MDSSTDTFAVVTPILFAGSLPDTDTVQNRLTSAVMPPAPSSTQSLMDVAKVPDSGSGSATSRGLVVCAPVSSGDLSTFAVACGRWLDLTSSGQPELGRTPSWLARTRAEKELGRSDLAVGIDKAAGLYGMTGVTDVACGTLTTSGSTISLTYTLYSLPGAHIVGSPISISGTQDEIVGELPGMARRIDAAMGVVSASIPTSVGLKANPLTQVQSIHGESYPSDDDLNFLYQASKTCPLAGMDLMDTRAHNDLAIFDGAEATLLGQLPNNSIPVFAGVSYSASDMWPFAKRHEALIARYPANALLAHTDVWEQRSWGNRAGELRAAKRYLNDSPGDPDAWLALGSTVGNVASDLRQARQAQDISPSEWSVLNSLYPLEEKADQHAVQLDPLHGHAWYKLASSATFQSDNLLAKLALDHAIALDPDKDEPYGWGLEMDQPKWGVDPANLSNLATSAANYSWTNSSNALDIASELQSAGFTSLYNQVLSQFVTSERARVAQHPNDAGMHWDLEQGLAAQNTPESLLEATQEGRIAVKLMPGCPTYHCDLGAVLDTRGLTSGAIAQYRLAIADDPYDSSLHTALAHDLKEVSDFPNALSELTVATRLDPSDAATHWTLAELLSKEGKYSQAIPECRAAISRDYFAVEARVQLAWLLDHEKQPGASIQAGLDSLHVLTEYTQPQTELDTGVRTTLADDYLQTKEWSASIAQSNAVLAEDSDNALAYENLAEADYGAGRTAKARTEWQRVVAMGNPALTSVAQKFLVQTENGVAM